MVALLEYLAVVVALLAVALLVGAAVGRFSRRAALAVLGLAQLAVMVGIGLDIAALVQGQPVPDMPTHVGYLLSTPLIIPAGLALTYRKIDRWGLLITGVATLIAAIMIVRQVQTMGIPFGYLNV